MQEHLLEFRDEKEKVAPLKEQEPLEAANDQTTTTVEDTLEGSVAHGTTPQQAATVLAQVPEAEQRRGLLWLSKNMGADYATKVADLLGGGDDPLKGQLRSLAKTVNAGPGQQGTRPETKGVPKADIEGKETLYKFSDPALGEFELFFDVDKGVKTNASTDAITISSPTGLTLRTPKGMEDITVRRIVLDLNSGQVKIDSEPDLGEFEEQILSNLVRETLMRDVDTHKLVNPATAGLAGLETDKKGQIYLLKSAKANALLDPSTKMSASLMSKSLRVELDKAIYVDVIGPFNMHIESFEYFFATQSVQLDVTPKGNIATGWIRNIIKNLATGAIKDLVVDHLPTAMKKKGYDPGRDPDIGEHFKELMGNFSGAKSEQDLQTPQGKADPSKTNTGGPQQNEAGDEKPDPFANADYQVLYRLHEGGKLGPVAVGMDQGDSLVIDKTASSVTISSGAGVFVVVAGSKWTRTLRLKTITYNFATDDLNIDASVPVGAAVTDFLEGMVRTVVLPKLPGAALAVLKDQPTREDPSKEPITTKEEVKPVVTEEVKPVVTEEVAPLTGAALRSAVRYNKGRKLSRKTIEAIQERLGIPVDGGMGPQTTKAIYQFQATRPELDNDGKLGKATRKALESPVAAPVRVPSKDADTQAGPAEEIAPLTDAALKSAVRYNKGRKLSRKAIEAIQKLLGIKVDGAMGPGTTRAIYEFQVARPELDNDGKLGRATRKALESPTSTPGPEPEPEAVHDDEQLLYSAPAKGLGTVNILAAADDSVKIIANDEAVELVAAKGIRIRVAGAKWIPEALIGRVHYAIATGKVTLDPPADMERALDQGPLMEAVIASLITTQIMPGLPGKVKHAAGLNEDEKVEMPEAEGNVLFDQDLDKKKEDATEPGKQEPQTQQQESENKFGHLDVSMAPGDQVDIKTDGEGTHVKVAGGILVRLPKLGVFTRVYEAHYQNDTGAFSAKSDPPLGAYETALVGNVIKKFVLPKADKHLAKNDAKPNDDRIVLFHSEGTNGVLDVCIDKGDAISIEEDADHLRISSEKGIYWLGSGKTTDLLPLNRIKGVSVDLNTGAVEIDGATKVGDLGNMLVTQLVQHYAAKRLDAETRKRVFGGKDIVQTNAEKIQDTDENVVVKTKAGDMGALDVSIHDSDTIGFKASQSAIELHVAHGVLVRMPAMNASVRVYDLSYDRATRKVTGRSEPKMGAYEQQLIEASLNKFLWPLISDYLKQQDGNLADKTTVLYKLDVGDHGKVRVCIDAGDALSIEQNDKEIVLSSGKGIYWFGSGDAKDMVDHNRIRRISLSLETGEVTIDADTKVGDLGNTLAQRLVQTMLLPKIPVELRDKLMGKNVATDPQTLKVPPHLGTMLYSGGKDDFAFDLSMAGAGLFSIDAMPNGLVRFDTKGQGILFRVPGVGISMYLWDLVLDPKTGQVKNVNTTPKAGPAELSLISKAAAHFVRPLVSKYVAESGSKRGQSNRTLASFGAFKLQIAAGDTFSIDHGEGQTVFHGSRRGFSLVSGQTTAPAVRFQKITYQHKTGKIKIDLVNQADKSVYKDPREVAGITEAALSELVRQVLDPKLTPEMRGLGLAGKEASPDKQRMPNFGTQPWMDKNFGELGKVQIFTARNEDFGIDVGASSLHLFSDTGILIKLPTLGLWTTVMDIRYDYATEDVQVEGLGRLENTLLQQVMSGLVKELVPDRKPKDSVGPVADTVAQYTDKSGKIVVKTEKGTVMIPNDGIVGVRISGERLLINFAKPLYFDGPGPGNYDFNKLEYHFADASVEWTINSKNPLAWMFTGMAHNKIGDALVKLIHTYLPPAMRRPGYNLMTDPNRPRNMRALVAGFHKVEGKPES